MLEVPAWAREAGPRAGSGKRSAIYTGEAERNQEMRSALIDFKKNSLDFTNECQLADNCWGIAEGKV